MAVILAVVINLLSVCFVWQTRHWHYSFFSLHRYILHLKLH